MSHTKSAKGNKKMGNAKKEKTGIPSYTLGVVSNVMSYIVV